MPLKHLLLPALLLAATISFSSAAESVIIEPPAPTSFSENAPAYLFFKKIEITPRDSGAYDVAITLLGDLPSSRPKDRGMDLTMSFDFAEIAPEKSTPSSHIPNFNADLNLMFMRNIGKNKFEPANPAAIEYRKRSFDVKVSNFIVKKDAISFTVRSPLFALHPASTVSFRINNMKATSPTQASGYPTQETAPVSPDLPGATAATQAPAANTAPDPNSIIIEPPAPASYNEEGPAFLYYKKIVITPRPPDAYQVAITLQGDFPNALPPDRHASFAMSFDFADLNPEKTRPNNFTPNFHPDYSVRLSRDNTIATFVPLAEPFKYHDREWKFEITTLAARADTITFTVRSPLFALHPAFTVSFLANYSRGNSGRFLQPTTRVSLEPSTKAPAN